MRERDRRILEIIARRPVTTQAELVAALRAAGIAVTQATVSRDIRRLGLVKVPAGTGPARYQAPPASVRPPAAELDARLRRAFGDYVAAIEEGSGLILVKTSTGSAGTVAEAIDEADWPDVAGTVAGDNTIIVVPRRAGVRRQVLRRLRGYLV
ncbi:MAG: arginine repressor [Armatimonadota bacterium]|nr:arginine repressor [Armatimonadota bacterium]MDR7453526.1 arginine repressor [Armatimonadota bacterium]MDR7457822.1 arginine repressor [Armatimonadota bacterium]MDR7495595.1 arginine repressor [Armatimonadota bacterium]MDR7512674.1 arginine repressor [Armatimonadota bacterium]